MIDQKDDETKRLRTRQGELEREVDSKKSILYEKQQLEGRLQLYVNEIDQMSRALEAKTLEIEELKAKLSQSFTLQYTIQHNETTINSLTVKISSLESDLKASRDSCLKAELENADLRKQVQQFKYQLQSLQ